MAANASETPKNAVSQETKKEIKSYTQSMLLYLSEELNFSKEDIAAALDLQPRTISEWMKPIKGQVHIPTKQSFLQLSLMRLQVPYVPREQMADLRSSSLLKYASAPILLSAAIRGGAGLGFGLGMIGLGAAAPIFGAVIGTVILNEYKNMIAREKALEERLEVTEIIDALTKKRAQATPSWDSIIEIVRNHPSHFLKPKFS